MRILIIGASGFLGSALYHYLKMEHEVFGTYYTQTQNGFLYLDLSDKHNLQNFLKTYKFDITIYCGGLTNPDFCEKYQDLAYKVNVHSTECIVNNSNSKIIYFSTDYVFDGKKKYYVEDDIPNPLNCYGKTKLEAEKFILENPKNVVIRVSGLYGFNHYNNEFINSLHKNNLVKATDLYGSTLLIDDVLKNISMFFGDKFGIYHLSSQNTISRYDFTNKALKILKIQNNLVGMKSDCLNLIAKRPINTTLKSERVNFKINAEEEGLEIIYNQLKNKKDANI